MSGEAARGPVDRFIDAIEMTAQIADLTGTCVEGAEHLLKDVSFTVTAQRRKAGPAREVYLPLFVSLAQGGNVLVSKQLTGVTLQFPEGGLRAEARGGAGRRGGRRRHQIRSQPRGCGGRPAWPE